MFQIERTVAISDTAPDGLLRLSHALDYLLECECFQMDSEDEFSVYLRNNGFAVFLAFRQVEIIRLPAYAEHLAVRTNVYESKNFFGFRNTAIYDAQGRLCILCAAIGAFVDRATGRPAKIPTNIIRGFHFDPPIPMEYLSRKITLPDREPECLAPFRVKSHQADMYGHFNSNRSLDETMEYLPEGFRFNRLRLEYKAQAKPGELITPAVYRGVPNPDALTFTLSNESSLCTVFEFSTAPEQPLQ